MEIFMESKMKHAKPDDMRLIPDETLMEKAIEELGMNEGGVR